MLIPGQSYIFPPVEEADADGLLAVGGDLSPACLLDAYRRGIFPWYNENEPICWWSPDPRCVLFPEKLYVSASMKQVLRKQPFLFTINKAFREVMESCRQADRGDSQGTWIQPDIIEAYSRLHELGFALSAETWQNGKLVGGLYGIQLGKVFFGESMFHSVSNASKVAFIHLVRELRQQGIAMIDCQVRTEHLVSLGAEMISRKTFINLLDELIGDIRPGKLSSG